MTGKTHAAVGLGTVLAVTQPSTVSGLVLAAGTGMLGALISDIDVGTSKSHKDADRITLIAVLLVAAEIALNYFYDFSIWEKIRNNQSMAPVAMGVIIFIAVCAFGKNQPHRSFMHSIMAMAILSAAISMVSVKLVLYFVVGFASHLVLDCFNRKRVRILYPLPGGIALDFCKAGGFVDSLLFKLGSVAVIFEIDIWLCRWERTGSFFECRGCFIYRLRIILYGADIVKPKKEQIFQIRKICSF